MTQKELIILHQAAIGKSATLILEGMQFPVKILGVKAAFSRVDVHITPLYGIGDKWFSSDKIILD